MLLRDVEVGPRRCDVRLSGGVISSIGGLSAHPEEDVVDGAGGALLPGLADHHLHLAAMAAARSSVDLSDGLEGLRDALPHGGWIRGIGVAPSALPSPADLDALRPDVPVRVQDRGGAVWVLNALAQDELGLDSVLWRQDDLLRERLGAGPPDLGPVVTDLLRSGVTHLTDATPDLSPERVTGLRAAVPQHLLLLGDPGETGPVKVVLGDHELPDLDELCARISAAHAAARPVAVHSVTAASLALLLAAWGEVGARTGDRLEHGAVIPPSALEVLAELAVTVVTQPTLVARRGAAYRAEADPADRRDLWRHASLAGHGIEVVCSSDAPYGDPDPWATIRAARDREPDREERVEPSVVLDGLLRDPRDLRRRREVAVGHPADLVLLRVPRAAALADPDADLVRLTLLRGELAAGGS